MLAADNPIGIHFPCHTVYSLLSISRLRVFFAIAAVMFLASCQSTPATLKIGYINTKLVMQQYHGTVARRQQIEQQATRWQASLDSLATALNQKSVPPMEQNSQISHYRNTLRQKIQTAGQEADRKLIKEVNAYLKAFGYQHHYAFILGATDEGNIVYAALENDVTAEVIKGLNEQYDK